MKDLFTEVENGMFFDNIEDALLTSCPLCSTPLDWSLSLVYQDHLGYSTIRGVSESCGYIFTITRTLNPYSGYYINMHKK